MIFKKYQHLEKLGSMATSGIEKGKCYIFSKIDGTNGSVWIDGDTVKAGSRNRTLSLGSDNSGFYAYILKQENIKKYLEKYPDRILYGEFLVPHTIKEYRDDSWRRFYVFDILDFSVDSIDGTYLRYDEYERELEEFDIDYIPPIAIIHNPTREALLRSLENANFLMKDGEKGEGIVIKNYEYRNSFGRVVWAKIVRSEFKDKFYKKMGAPEIVCSTIIEDKIVKEYMTEHLIRKTYDKICLENGGWDSKFIPQLLGRTWYDFITEEIFEILKKEKNPCIDFKIMRGFATNRVKDVLTELF